MNAPQNWHVDSKLHSKLAPLSGELRELLHTGQDADMAATDKITEILLIAGHAGDPDVQFMGHIKADGTQGEQQQLNTHVLVSLVGFCKLNAGGKVIVADPEVTRETDISSTKRLLGRVCYFVEWMTANDASKRGTHWKVDSRSKALKVRGSVFYTEKELAEDEDREKEWIVISDTKNRAKLNLQCRSRLGIKAPEREKGKSTLTTSLEFIVSQFAEMVKEKQVPSDELYQNIRASFQWHLRMLDCINADSGELDYGQIELMYQPDDNRPESEASDSAEAA